MPAIPGMINGGSLLKSPATLPGSGQNRLLNSDENGQVTLIDSAGFDAAGAAAAAQAAAVQRANHTGTQAISTVSGLQAAIDAKAPLASPDLTGTPTAPTAPDATSSTQLATTAFVHSLITALIGAAPAALDTLSELSDAINDDANFAATVTTALATKLAKASNLSDLTDAAAARSNLGLVIGTNVEAHDADLTTIAGLTPSNDDILQRKAGAWTNRTIAQLLTDLGLSSLYQPLDSDLTAIAALTTTTFGRAFLSLADAAALRTAGGLVIGTDVQAFNATLAALAGMSLSQGDILYRDGSALVKLAAGTAGFRLETGGSGANPAWTDKTPAIAKNPGPTGSIGSTYDRAVFVEGTSSAVNTSARLDLVRILLEKGQVITSISFWSFTTAGGSLANQWFALFDSSRLKLAITSDDTSTAWGTHTKKTLSLTTPYTVPASGWYYLGKMIKATTMPTLIALTSVGTANVRAAAPIPCGSADTGLTDPASCPSTAAALTALSAMIYGEVN